MTVCRAYRPGVLSVQRLSGQFVRCRVIFQATPALQGLLLWLNQLCKALSLMAALATHRCTDSSWCARLLI